MFNERIKNSSGCLPNYAVVDFLGKFLVLQLTFREEQWKMNPRLGPNLVLMVLMVVVVVPGSLQDSGGDITNINS